MSFVEPQESDGASPATDAVRISRADTNAQVFAAARPMDVNVYEVAEVMDHPLENGASVVDHIVYKPVELEIPLHVGGENLSALYGEIRDLFRAGTLLTVQTRARLYESMLIQAIPHEERPEAIDALSVNLQLRQADFVPAQYAGAEPIQRTQVAPTRRAQARTSTQQRGAQQPATPPPAAAERGSTLFRVFGR